MCSYEFETFRLVVGEKQLFNRGEPVPLPPKAFDTLLALVGRHGHLVLKADLLREVWPDCLVEESNLAQNIHHLRKALGGGRREHKFIETVPRRGYRFVAGVREVCEEARADDPRRVPGERALPKSIAVLPFTPIGGVGGGDDRLLGLGMADALIGKLSNSQTVPVLPTGSVLRYAGRAPDPFAAGRDLGVEAVVSGTVQVSGREVRVGVQLVSVADRRAVWAGNFDDEYDNVFALQDLISEKVASELALRITPEGRRELSRRQTDDTGAYHDYLMGLYSWNKRSEEGLSNAIEYLRRAVEKDAGYALAHALLADSYMLVIYNRYGYLTPAEAHRRAKASATRALEVNERLAEAHTALAAVRSYEGDDDAAQRALAHAIALNPSHPAARQRYGWQLVRAGRLREAVEEMKRAQEFDPLSAVYNTSLTCVLNYARRHEEAVRYGRLAVELDPKLYDAHINLGEAYEFSGLHREAAAQFEKARALDARNTYAAGCLGHIYARTGRGRAARRALLALEESAVESAAPLYGIALIQAALGQKERALSSLEKAIVRRSVRVFHVRYDPKLDTLRTLPGFREMLSRHGLERLLTQ